MRLSTTLAQCCLCMAAFSIWSLLRYPKTPSPYRSTNQVKGQRITMNGHRCIIEYPPQFAGEDGIVMEDNYLGTGLVLVRFLRISVSAVFSRAEIRILPVML